MARPAKRANSANYQFRKVTPKDIWAARDKLAAMGIRVAREVTQSLRTSNAADARREHSRLSNEWEQRWRAMREALERGPSSLTQKQVAALAGNIARRLLASDRVISDGMVEVEGMGTLRVTWERSAELFKLIETHGLERYPYLRGPLEQMIDHELHHGELAAHGIIAIDQHSRQALVDRIVSDLPMMASMLHGMQYDGDYREPDRLKGRPEVGKTVAKVVTFASLLDGWMRSDRQPKEESVRTYSDRIKAFTRFPGHQDAAKVARADVQRWKDHLLAQKDRSLKGSKVKLDAVRSLLNWAIENGRLPYQDNPARGVVISLRKEGKKRRGFTDDEARMILGAARRQGEFLRWGTWLMFYSGMRPGEVAQLRVADVVQDGNGDWSVKVTSEAGTVKTRSSERTIPLHSAVVSEGLPAYVKTLDANGRLFPELYLSANGRKLSNYQASKHAGRIARDRMRRMLEGIEGFTKADDVSIQHSWRHRMTTMMREHCQHAATAEAILGHKGAGMTGSYGEGPSLQRLRQEIERIPAMVLRDAASDGLEVRVIKRTKAARARVKKVKLPPSNARAKGKASKR